MEQIIRLVQFDDAVEEEHKQICEAQVVNDEMDDHEELVVDDR